MDVMEGVKVRKITQKDLKGNEIKVWDSLSDAVLGTNIKHTFITRACKGRITAGGFLWEYHKEDNPDKKKPVRKIIQKDLNDNFIKAWDSFLEIKKETGFMIKTLSDVCKLNKKNGNKYSAYDYIWELWTGEKEYLKKQERVTETGGIFIE